MTDPSREISIHRKRKMWEQQQEAQAGDSPTGAGGAGGGPDLGSPRLQGGWETPIGPRDIRS